MSLWNPHKNTYIAQIFAVRKYQIDGELEHVPVIEAFMTAAFPQFPGQRPASASNWFYQKDLVY